MVPWPLLPAALSATPPQPPLPVVRVLVGDAVLQVEVADEPEERARGLMGRSALADGAGMLFVYPAPAPRRFWMRDTTIPLSAAFIDESGVIFRIADMRPLDETPVPSGGAALYVLEVPRGWFTAHGVAPGTRVQGLPPPSAE